MPEHPLPIVLPIVMVAAFLTVMVAIKLYVAPLILLNFGWIGVPVTILVCLAFGKMLED